MGTKDPSSVIVSFAMHPDTTGGTLYSADYIHGLDERLKHYFGPDFKVLFGTGTCGDINHRDVHSQKQRTADELGSMLGDAVENATKKGELSAIKHPTLAVRTTKVPGKLQEISAADIAKANSTMEHLGTPGFPFMEAVKPARSWMLSG